MKISTKEFYEKLNRKKLSEQEVLETKNNFVGFFDLLYCIDRRNEKKRITFIDVSYEFSFKSAKRKGGFKELVCKIIVFVSKIFFVGLTLLATDYLVVWKNLFIVWEYLLAFFK